MLTKEQADSNIREIEIYGKKYRFYIYELGGNETFEQSDFELYNLDGLSVIGDGECLDLCEIKDFSNIKLIILSRYQYTSIDTLQTFCVLEHFTIFDLCDAPIPFDKFTKLRSARVNYEHKTRKKLFDNYNIEYLTLYHYKQKTYDAFAGLAKLKHLGLQQCRVPDLDFLEFLPELRYLDLRYNRTLKSIRGIAQAKNLKGLSIHDCKNIEDWESLSQMRQLKALRIEDCGEIPSLEFLSSLPELRILELIGNTKIMDGALKSIVENKSLEVSSIEMYKHYNIEKSDRKKAFPPFAERNKLWESCNFYL